MIRIISFILFFIVFISFGAYTQEFKIPNESDIIEGGKLLFEENCTVCHAINEEVIGPALSGVHERRNIDWIKSFIRNSQKVIQSGDEYAVNLYEKYNRTQMTSFDFSDDQIVSIVAYIKNYKPEVSASVASSSSEDLGNFSNDNIISDGYFFILGCILLFILALILFLLILMFNFVISLVRLKSNLSDSDKVFIEQSVSFRKIFQNSIFKRLVFFVFVSVIFKSVISGLFSIGVQKGYSPRQPIAFSHQIHVGQYQIDCQYCHTGVVKSKNANIPSLNICMNCHSAIKKDSVEIKKIYLAIENNIPIEWIRVHNLSKLAYFNHSQHVKVGGLECQDCHGPVEEMDVIYQYSSLTMGWCIDCHRKKEINAKGNEYYDYLIQIHSKDNNDHLKVEDIGGLECGKCHY